MILAAVRFYRRWLSPLKRMPTCRFLPTCSEYAIEAVEVHGAAKGSLLALWRLLRCHPFCRGGHDPVPSPRGFAGLEGPEEMIGKLGNGRSR